MPNDYISKLKSLSPSLQAKLAAEEILAELDELDGQYGIKAVLILLGLLSGELDYADLSEKLKADYGFNDFLATEVKKKFGDLIKELGEGETAAVKSSNGDVSADYPMTFSQADEVEVKKYVNLSAAVPADYSGAASKLAAAFGYPSADEVMLKRLENIIVARLKDVRDDLETKENLMKSKKVGGLEFSEAEVDKLLNLIKNQGNFTHIEELNKNTRDPSARPLGLGRDDNSRDKVNGINQPTIEMEDGLPVVRLPESLMVKAPAAVAIKENLIIPVEKLPIAEVNDKIKPAIEEKFPLPAPQPYLATKKIPESVINAKTASKPNLDDVKLGKKLMGPIEELEMMTIIDFRRLAADPQAAVNKIKEKIDLLQQEGLDRRVAGINA
ncbi:MAG: hypothetical protein WC517_02915, partial [Patescibacteria group bacterium]